MSVCLFTLISETAGPILKQIFAIEIWQAYLTIWCNKTITIGNKKGYVNINNCMWLATNVWVNIATIIELSKTLATNVWFLSFKL